MIILSSETQSWESSRNQLYTIIDYEHKIDQEQEVRVHSMSLPSAFRVDARGSLKFRQVAILAARPAQLLGLKHATNVQNKCCIVKLGSKISLPLRFAQ